MKRLLCKVLGHRHRFALGRCCYDEWCAEPRSRVKLYCRRCGEIWR